MARQFPRIAVLAATVLLGTACGTKGDSQPVALKADRVEHEGVSLELPNGWEGRILALDHPAAVLQAANFTFPPVGIELPPGEEDPIKAMTAEHALVSVLPCGLVSFEEAAQPAPEQLALEDLTFLPAQHPRVPRGHAFAHASLDFPDRCLRIAVDFGGTPPSSKLTDVVNGVLASLAVADG